MQELLNLLKHGVDPSCADFDQRSPLMIAAREGNDVSHAVLERGQGGGGREGATAGGKLTGKASMLFLSRYRSGEQRETRQTLGNTLVAC